jgi:TolA-binding protein
MLRFIIILFSAVICYLNFIVFKSYVIQTNVVEDFNTLNFKEENYRKLENTEINFPNISATGFPMYALLANYKIMFQDFNGALEILNNNKDINPYLRVRESLKAEVFFRLGVRDSSYYYSKIAFDSLPRNSRHFRQYVTELTWRKDLDEINKIFLKSKSKSNQEYWLTYLSAVINLKANEDNHIDSLAKVALKKFPKDNKIKAIVGYILYGQENIKKSYVLFDEGIKSYNESDFDSASKKFIEAVKLNPIDYSFKENAGMSLINKGNFKEAITYLEQSLNTIDKPNDGKAEYGLGMCYKELKQKAKSCEYLSKAIRLNYKPAFNYFSQNCNK